MSSASRRYFYSVHHLFLLPLLVPITWVGHCDSWSQELDQPDADDKPSKAHHSWPGSQTPMGLCKCSPYFTGWFGVYLEWMCQEDLKNPEYFKYFKLLFFWILTFNRPTLSCCGAFIDTVEKKITYSFGILSVSIVSGFFPHLFQSISS